MARYIDLEVLEKRIQKYVKTEIPEETTLVEYYTDECIKQGYAIPAADVVEVVRCKDCRYCSNNSSLSIYRCASFMAIISPNHFCSLGVRRKDEI